ncbi:UNVERIFIED_CONTAM: hypothetical protein FKN15_072321 [Acipenser sinensis]
MVYYVYGMFLCCWERDESLIEDGGKTLKKKQTLCEVAFAYSPLDKDELELKEGEIIEFIKEIEDGWWLGNKNGKVGAFPSNFVKEITGKATFALSLMIAVTCNIAAIPACSCYWSFTLSPLLRDLTCVLMLLDLETTDGPNSSAVKQRPKLSEALFNKELEKLADYQNLKITPKTTFTTMSKPGVPAMDIKNCSDHSRPEAALLKDERKDLRSDPSSKQLLPPLKKVPPPVKNKPVKTLPSKTNGEIAPLSPKPTEMVKEKAKETDSIPIEDVAVSSDKLSHPTANRAKHQGRRPPSHPVINKTTAEKPLLSPVTPKNDHAASHFPRVTSPLKAIPSQSIPETKPKAEQETHENIEELKAEIKELSLALALLKNHHVRDIEDLKKEMKAEAAKRMALQEAYACVMDSLQSCVQIMTPMQQGAGWE